LDRAAQLADAADTRDVVDHPPPPPGVALVTAPFAGRVGEVAVDEGDTVDDGETVAMLEAMKMEVAVPAPRAGTVTWIGCRQGQLVAAGQPLVGVAPRP
jgi:biotin carboxyl carrier protein